MATMTEQVQAYLDKHAAEDAVFAEKMRNPRKSIKNCIAFIAQKAREYMQKHADQYKMDGGFGGDVDDEICFGWANHYYDETGLEVDMTEEERKAKREKEAAERKAKADAAKKAAKAKADEEKKPASPAAPKPAAKPEPEKKPEPKPEKEKKLTKTELRRGADCYSLFDF